MDAQARGIIDVSGARFGEKAATPPREKILCDWSQRRERFSNSPAEYERALTELHRFNLILQVLSIFVSIFGVTELPQLVGGHRRADARNRKTCPAPRPRQHLSRMSLPRHE